MQPKDEDELVDMIHTGLEHKGPAFIRYPRGTAVGTPIKENAQCLEIGKAEVLREGSDITLWALGPMVQEALVIKEELKANYSIDAMVVNARFVKPLDTELLFEQAKYLKHIVTLEDHVKMGGFGSAVLEALQEEGIHTPVTRIGWPDRFIPHGSSVGDLRNTHGLSRKDMIETIFTAYETQTLALA